MAIFQVNSIDIYTHPDRPDQELIPFGQIFFDNVTKKLGCSDEPVEPTDFANKAYVDNAITAAIEAILPLLKGEK